MIAVLLTILKVIGWVLLALLSLIVLILLILLLVPVRYRIEAQGGKDLAHLQVHGRATWLLHLISLAIDFEDKELSTHARIAWKRLDEEKEEEPPRASSEDSKKEEIPAESRESSEEHAGITLTDKRDEENAEGDKQDKQTDAWVTDDRYDNIEVQSDHPVNTMTEEQRDPVVHMVVPHAEEESPAEAEIRIKERKRKDKAEKKKEKREKKEQKKREKAAEKEQKQLKKKAERKERAEEKEQRKKEKEAKRANRKKRKLPDFDHIREVVRSVGDRREDIMSFIENASHRKAMAHLWKRLKKTGKKLIPKDYGLSGSAGMTDPYTTGRLAVINSMLFSRIGEKVDIDFNFEEPVLDLKGHAKGKIRLGTFVAMIFPLLLDRNIWRTIKDAIELKKKLDETSELIKGGKAA